MWQLLLGGLLGMSGIASAFQSPNAGGAVDGVLVNYYNSATNRKQAANPIKPIDVNSSLPAFFRGFVNKRTLYSESAKMGIRHAGVDIAIESARGIPTTSEIIAAFYKGQLNRKGVGDQLSRYGIQKNDAKLMIDAQEAIPAATELVQARFRKIIEADQYYDKMKALGYSNTNAKIIYEASKYIPGPSDLIRFQVRDVFNPAIVAKYKYDEEFPVNILPHAEKLGMAKETLEQYWRAHWYLPSPTQAFEMLRRLHPEVLARVGNKYDDMGLTRKDITTDTHTVQELLKINDYPKYWRDRLIAIAYQNLTRVDLRRLYVDGIISDDKTLATLREHGYTKQDANLLFSWYKHERDRKLNAPLVKGVLESYSYGLISREDTQALLAKYGVKEAEVKAKVFSKTKQMETKDLKDFIELQTIYLIEGKTTVDKFRDALFRKGLKTDKVNLVIEKAQLKVDKETQPPSYTQASKMYKYHIIEKPRFKQILGELGYAKEYHEELILLATITKEKAAAKKP